MALRTDDILFLDLELRPKDQSLMMAGAVLGDKSLASPKLAGILDMVRSARVLAGHNLVAHDRIWLERQPIAEPLLQLPPLDTLLLSVLLRPDHHRHRLQKDYKRHLDSRNDPVEDARLCADLLVDLGLHFHQLPAAEQAVLAGLLGEEHGFVPFFELFPPQSAPLKRAALVAQLHALLADRVCRNADLQLLIDNGGRRELAFVMAIIRGETPQIFTPSWLRFAFPMVERVFRRLRMKACDDPGCDYCANRLDPKKGLVRHFGYVDFRRFEGDGAVPLQERAVQAALRGESLVAIFPTGGGKSLTFQLPALLRAEADNALTVVISPLQSLMKDQVDNLRNNFNVVSAVAINGLLNPLERQEAIQAVENGKASILYLSPESLRSHSIFQLLLGRTIARFVIDEAHCFSAWGQDFRVDYLYIGNFIMDLRSQSLRPDDIPVSCFTATAKQEVIADIKAYFEEKLGLAKMQVYQTLQARTNLHYQAIATQDQEKKFQRLLEALDETEGPVIVYVSRVNTSERLAQSLTGRGYNAAAYNGKMDSAAKIAIQDRFKSNELRIIVATTAFGMGVDKDNVALVVHYEISNSLENYQQEAGRAGRKESLHAKCLVLFDENDLGAHFELLQGTKLNKKEIEQIWKAVKAFKRECITKSALEIAKAAGWDEEMRDLETRVKTAINALESVGYVNRGFNSPVIFADSLRPRNFEGARAILYRNAEQFTQEQLGMAERIVQYLYGKEEIAVDFMADHLGIELRLMATLLALLKSIGILAEDRDMAARLHGRRSKDAPQPRLRMMLDLEEWMYHTIFPHGGTDHRKVHLRQLNSDLAADSTFKHQALIVDIKTVMRYWKFHRIILSEREDAEEDVYAFRLRIPQEEYDAQFHSRKVLSVEVLTQLEAIQSRDAGGTSEKEKNEVEFSVGELQKLVLSANIFLQETNIRDVEEALLYLHDAEVIELLRGMLVYYNRITLQRLQMNNRKGYTDDDYKSLHDHYLKKVEQIHIVGEYGKRLIGNQLSALVFTHDYFTLLYPEFIDKYFKGRETKLRQPLTEAKFKQLIEQLNTEQLAVVKDNAQRILVAAGPGSGKTRVLVHKMASLLLLEDVKPEQLLVLTFTRVAALEFKSRLIALVPGIGKRVDIFTYHSYAFRLLGKMGDMTHSDQVLETATQAILAEEVPLDRIAAKSVLMLDEFQDVSVKEWNFLQAVIGKAGDEQASDKLNDPRIVAAGDDDQCIYEFRGASLEYMQRFMEQDAKAHYFVRNYRSAPNLVAFSNAFLTHLPKGRLKGGHTLESTQQELGELNLVRYRSGYMIEPLVNALALHRREGTVAVLTTTNEEAATVHTLLRRRNILATLVRQTEGFRIGQLNEFEWFTKELVTATSGTEEGWISSKVVDELLERMRQQFARSKDRPFVEQSIRTFMGEDKRRHREDWKEFRLQLRMEDVLAPEQGKVYVTTIHKAKGKEFDAVFLLLDNYKLEEAATARAVYVAITRAKQFLEIHTNGPELDWIAVDGLRRTEGQGASQPPNEWVMECSLKDVWLDGFKRIAGILNTHQLQAGDPLYLDPQSSNHLADQHGKLLLRFSKEMMDRMEKRRAMGFRIAECTVGHVVQRYDDKDRRTYGVVLPWVLMRR